MNREETRNAFRMKITGDNSYLTGRPWLAEYQRDEATKFVAEVTLVDKFGKKMKEQVEILFGDRDSTGDATATLDVLPKQSLEDGLVHLYKDTHEVAFYARRSKGDIIEYRIDKNVLIDACNTISFLL